MNQFLIGKLGKTTKIMTFKEHEFKKELAPPHAKTKTLEINGERFVRMKYDL